jgi:crotonobetainyl-CoA:carnitine CoA-transferase CaiB-like acyl-CoA transferase
VNVLELGGGSVALSYCGYLLAALGHEVAKVESTAGDPIRLWGPFPEDRPDGEGGLYAALNRGKQVAALDLDLPSGRALLAERLEWADVVLHDFAPGRAARLGFGASAAAEAGLISVSISGFGAVGPYADAVSYPINAAALGGISVGIGRPGEKPLTIPLGLGRYQAGLCAAIGVLACARARDDVGGQEVDVSEADVWATVHTGQNVLTFLYLGISGIRAGNHGIGQYPNSFLRCKDGYVCITLTPLPQWLKLLELMGEPEWTKQERYRNRRAMTEEYPDEVDALIAPWFEERTMAQILDIARDSGLPIVPALGVGDLLENEHLEARRAFESIELADGGSYRVPGLPFKGEAHAGTAAAVGRARRSSGALLGIPAADLDQAFECEVIG